MICKITQRCKNVFRWKRNFVFLEKKSNCDDWFLCFSFSFPESGLPITDKIGKCFLLSLNLVERKIKLTCYNAKISNQQRVCCNQFYCKHFILKHFFFSLLYCPLVFFPYYGKKNSLKSLNRNKVLLKFPIKNECLGTWPCNETWSTLRMCVPINLTFESH